MSTNFEGDLVPISGVFNGYLLNKSEKCKEMEFAVPTDNHQMSQVIDNGSSASSITSVSGASASFLLI